jgi:SAM-dependent methyltransferase
VRLLEDPALVRREYADDAGLSARISAQQNATGPDPREVALVAVGETAPRDVLEVGSGRGELAERIRSEIGARVVALDQSEHMVALTAARGVEAQVGDVQALPFADASFDCAVAAWMLYHVAGLDRALDELARVLRPGGRLVAVTNSVHSQHELWSLVGYVPDYGFGAENGEEALHRHFATVERRDVEGTLTFPDRAAAHAYVSASPVAGEGAADRLPDFAGPLDCTRRVTVFVAEKAA